MSMNAAWSGTADWSTDTKAGMGSAKRGAGDRINSFLVAATHRIHGWRARVQRAEVIYPLYVQVQSPAWQTSGVAALQDELSWGQVWRAAP